MSRSLPVQRKHNLLTKAEEEPLVGIGKSPEERDILETLDRGVINLDKVAGPTSHEVVSWVKKIFNKTNVFKTAHGGTLDPKVTGILPVALNRAVRAIDVLLTAGKEYTCIMKLHGNEVESKIRTAMHHFEGKIYQRPPVRAAVKRTLRIREIYYLDILEIIERKVLFRVGCEAGTYIRKLCYDIGEIIGCGAHMDELRRTQSGPFKEDESMVTLQDLSDAVYYWMEENDGSELERIVKPMEIMFSHVPKIVIRDSAVDPLCHGANLTAPGILQLDADIHGKDTVVILTQKGEILALGTSLASSREKKKKKSGILVNTNRVFMEPGTYPKWVKKTE